MPIRVKGLKARGRHHIREWREYRELTQQQLADRLETSKTTIWRIENYEQPYTQDFLEACAEALATDPASLIMRNPKEDHIWSIWEQAKPGQKKQIVEVARTLMGFGKTGTDH